MNGRKYKSLVKNPRLNSANLDRLGLPQMLQIIRTEKCIATISAKVEPSMARYIKQQGGSSFIHTLLLEALTNSRKRRSV